MSTYILSYPGPGFQPQGVDDPANRNAHRAFSQWLELCDHITRAGGRILVLNPPASSSVDSQAASKLDPYASRIGAPFLAPATGEGPLFLRNRQVGEQESAHHADSVSETLRQAGLKVLNAQQRWQGQADIIALPRNRFLLTYGPHSDLASCDEVKRLLPMKAHVLYVEVDGAAGLCGFAHLSAKGGASLLLINSAILRSHSPEEIGKFVGDKTELHLLSQEDAAAQATQSLCVRGVALIPKGTSTQFRSQLVRRGFQYVEVDVSALFGLGGGGPRDLCNEWPGFVLSEDAPSYATRRTELFAQLANYPQA